MCSFNPASWTILAVFVAVLLTVLLAPMLLTAYYNTSSRLEALRNSEFRIQRPGAGNLAGHIGHLRNDIRHTVSNIASEPIMSDALARKKNGAYQKAPDRLQRYLAVNANGDLVKAMDQTGAAIVSGVPTTLGDNDKFRKYQAQAMPFVDAALLLAPVSPGIA